jgi:hypothetical protein
MSASKTKSEKSVELRKILCKNINDHLIKLSVQEILLLQKFNEADTPKQELKIQINYVKNNL